MFFVSLLAMLSWSGSDLWSKLGSREENRFSPLKMGVAVGAVMGLHALFSVTFGGVSLLWRDLVFYLPASALYIASMLLGYLALRYIELSVSSPICNSSGAVALLLSLCYFGVKWTEEEESDAVFLNVPIILGVVAVAAGVIALGVVDYTENDEARALRREASGRKYTKSALALLLPLLYCLLDAGGTFVDTLLADRYIERLLAADPALTPAAADLLCGDVLNTAYELTWAAMALVLLVFLLCKREKPTLRADGAKVIGAVCETVGQVFYMMVVVSDYKIGLVIISAYCALSLVWSRIFLREKLSPAHYAAIAVTFAGIVTLGVYDI